MVQLDDRKREVLRAVVEEHIRSAEPIGSEHATIRAQLQVSSATIRNTMAGLEEMGLLTHPHTSAGRVPTDQGYRLYVDMMLDGEPLAAGERQAIRRRLAGAVQAPEDLLDHAGRILSSLTQYASVVAAPGLSHQFFEALHLVPLDEHRALAVLSTSSGALQGRPITLPEGVTRDDLESLARAITHQLHGCRMGEITHERLEQAVGEAYRHQRLLDTVKVWLRRDLARGARPRLHVEGVRHLLREPEFRRPEAATPVLEALEEETILAQAIADAPDDGVWITIGAENRFAELQACSIVIATYHGPGVAGGTVAIVGPTRMRYRRAVAAVSYVAERLSEALGA